MLESPEVRSTIGSLISNLVANPSREFQEKLRTAKMTGLTRLECTIYSGEIHEYKWYTAALEKMQDTLRGCPVHKTSFEQQWKALVDEIINASTITVYDRKRKTFAYCHWYNNLTGKKQGYTKEQVEENEVMWLLAAYSFNRVPMHYICLNAEENGNYEILEKATYQRSEESSGITLVPGIQKGLYPSFEGITRQTLTFPEIGLVPYKSIIIGWPESKVDSRNRPLANLTMLSHETDSNTLKTTDNPKTSTYKAGHEILRPQTVYKVINISRKTYHNKDTLFAILKEETANIHVRAGPSLERTIREKEEKGIQFYIRTGDIYWTKNKHKDIKVEKLD